MDPNNFITLWNFGLQIISIFKKLDNQQNGWWEMSPYLIETGKKMTSAVFFDFFSKMIIFFDWLKKVL